MSCSKPRAESRNPRATANGALMTGAISPTTLASDAEREQTAAQLRAAHGEGRLDYSELEERTAAAYCARTHGDLAALTSDLPPAPVPQPDSPAPVNGARIALAASWGAWATAVAINVLIWLLVSLGADQAVYFWPIWVAGPWGAVLAVTSIATVVATRSGRPRSGRPRSGRH
jgi:hypothetical protein